MDPDTDVWRQKRNMVYGTFHHISWTFFMSPRDSHKRMYAQSNIIRKSNSRKGATSKFVESVNTTLRCQTDRWMEVALIRYFSPRRCTRFIPRANTMLYFSFFSSLLGTRKIFPSRFRPSRVIKAFVMQSFVELASPSSTQWAQRDITHGYTFFLLWMTSLKTVMRAFIESAGEKLAPFPILENYEC